MDEPLPPDEKAERYRIFAAWVQPGLFAAHIRVPLTL